MIRSRFGVLKNQIQYGRLRYISFIILNVLCLVLANVLAARLYLGKGLHHYGFDDYRSIVMYMIPIDVFVALCFNTLNRVLRRNTGAEVLESAKHVVISFVLLALLLFTTKLGAEYSRVTVYLAYGIDFVLVVVLHTVWKGALRLLRRKSANPAALLMTTDGFVEEGLEELRRKGTDVKYVFLLKNIQRESVHEIPAIKEVEQAATIICWKWIDRVYIYGLDHQMVPAPLVASCREMGVEIDTVNFDYKVLELKTITNADPKYGSLSFLEGKRDIPFPIRRVYWITETEASLHRGFHSHKLNCQLLFCPHGKIDILLDNGLGEKSTVTLEGPGKGLLLMPGMWREMVWRESGSVLCVLASEYYDPNEYIRDYDEFIAYTRDKKTA